MFVEILLTVNEMEEDLLKGKTAVVIDTLRATSTITTALYHGALEVIPKEGVEEARELGATLESGTYLLGGERGGIQLEGFHRGNSPLEYDKESIAGKSIILSTTNGTKAIHRAWTADQILIGSLLNSQRTAERIYELKQDLVLCCSGTQGHFSLEDFVTAGAMVNDLIQMGVQVAGDDRVQTARMLYERYADQLVDLISCSQNGSRLLQIGQLQDVQFCAEKDLYPIVCCCRENKIYLG